MALVLIADVCKTSILMSSEVFKDTIQGSQVVIAETGKECLEFAKKNKPDIVLVDFDLPDADGPSLIKNLRKFYHGPILMTAYPDLIVEKLVAEDLFLYNDSSDWVKKPVRPDDLEKKIQHFLVKNRRINRRFTVNFETHLKTIKTSVKKKVAPQIKGHCVNISLSGALVEIEATQPIKNGTVLTLEVPKNAYDDDLKVAATKATKKTKKTSTLAKKTAPKRKAGSFAKIEGKVAWGEDGKVAVKFTELSDAQKDTIESYIISSFEMPGEKRKSKK